MMNSKDSDDNFYVIFTVDTEFSNHKDTLGVWGKIEGREYGVKQLVNLFDKHQVKATFFIDVYQKLEEMKKACDFLKAHDHDLQFHTHPNWCFDRKRGSLCLYSYEEQCEIIEYGREKFIQLTGEAPQVHRAGDFGANLETLRALKVYNILCDFSYFWQWPDCQLSQELEVKNRVTRIDSMLLVPVTCFFSPGLGISKSYRLLDINEPLILLKQVFRALKCANIRTIVVVLHSFSLIECNQVPFGKFAQRQIYWPIYKNIKKLDQLLRWLKKDQAFHFITAKDYCVLVKKQPDLLDGNDNIPQFNRLSSTYRLAFRSSRMFLDRTWCCYRYSSRIPKKSLTMPGESQ